MLRKVTVSHEVGAHGLFKPPEAVWEIHLPIMGCRIALKWVACTEPRFASLRGATLPHTQKERFLWL